MQIFISHAKEDNPIVYQILKMLDDNQIRHWQDLTRIDVSSSINKEINDAISSSSHFLLIWSKNANKSTFVQKEYNSAITPDYDYKLKKIIIRLDDTRLPALLADLRYYRISSDELEKTMHEIIFDIKKLDNEDERQKKFDDYLDEKFDNIFIADHEYSTSYALKNIDNKTYHENMLSWEDVLNEEGN